MSSPNSISVSSLRYLEIRALYIVNATCILWLCERGSAPIVYCLESIPTWRRGTDRWVVSAQNPVRCVTKCKFNMRHNGTEQTSSTNPIATPFCIHTIQNEKNRIFELSVFHVFPSHHKLRSIRCSLGTFFILVQQYIVEGASGCCCCWCHPPQQPPFTYTISYTHSYVLGYTS